MYRFLELGKRAKLVACGEYIKHWKFIYPNLDITIDTARFIVSGFKCNDFAFDINGHIVNPEGFYIRKVPATGNWTFYYLYNDALLYFDDDMLDWNYSVYSRPFKSDGFKRIKI